MSTLSVGLKVTFALYSRLLSRTKLSTLLGPVKLRFGEHGKVYTGRGAGFPGLLRQDWWYSSSTGEADFRDVTAWVIKHDPLSESAEDTSLQAPQLPGVTNVLPHMSESAIENHELKWFL